MSYLSGRANSIRTVLLSFLQLGPGLGTYLTLGFYYARQLTLVRPSNYSSNITLSRRLPDDSGYEYRDPSGKEPKGSVPWPQNKPQGYLWLSPCPNFRTLSAPCISKSIPSRERVIRTHSEQQRAEKQPRKRTWQMNCWHRPRHQTLVRRC